MSANRGLVDLTSLYILTQLVSVSLPFVICLTFIVGYRTEAISSQQDRRSRTKAAAQLTSENLWETSPAQSEAEKPFSDVVMSIHQQVNELRRAQGLKPLTLNPIISVQAKRHSIEMARNGSTVSHRGFDERLREIQSKLPHRAAAENVAVNIGYKNPAREAVKGWNNSQRHRKNMLGDYNLTGIGVARSPQGHYFFTQIFLRQ